MIFFGVKKLGVVRVGRALIVPGTRALTTVGRTRDKRSTNIIQMSDLSDFVTSLWCLCLRGGSVVGATACALSIPAASVSLFGSLVGGFN